MNGRGTDLGDKEVTVRVDLGERWTDGATLYQLVNGQATPLESVKVDGTVLEGRSTVLHGSWPECRPLKSRAAAETWSRSSSLRWWRSSVIVAGSVLISLRNRRPRTVATRRTLGSRGRF